MKIKLLPKQTKALDYLQDEKTSQVLFGGSVGSSKSFLGCTWIVLNCFKYPSTRWVVGRSKLKTLRQTTLQTLFEVMEIMEINSSHWNYNQQDNEITFSNGSKIILKDLFFYPSDPNFDSLGSLEITGAFVDECNQIVFKAWQVLKSRIRYKLNAYDIDGTPTKTLKVAEVNDKGIPIAWYRKDGSITRGLLEKMLGTCNPSKNWVYNYFYKPQKEGELPEDRVFIQSLTRDNPYLPDSYIDSLRSLDKNSRERLLFGNWEYDDDPAKLIEYDKILDLYENTQVPSGSKYITADIATKGSDRFVLCVWDGLRLIKIYSEAKSTGLGIIEKIKEFKNKYGVPNSNICYDADGVGGGLSGFLANTIEFKNGSKAKAGENFNHLKSQCYFKLADYVNEGKIWVVDDTYQDKLNEELEYIKRDNVDKDGKLSILPKDKVKELLGRSPDYSDALMMRMYWEVSGKIQTFNPRFF